MMLQKSWVLRNRIIVLTVMLVFANFIITFDKSNVTAETFTLSIRADDTGANLSAQKYPTIAVDNNNGKIFLMYEDWRNDEDGWHTPTPGVDGVLDSDIYLCNSTDKGQSFGTCRRVNDDTGKAMQTTYATITTNMVVDKNGIIHAVWTDWRNDADGYEINPGGGVDGLNNSDIYYANSSDGGMTFSVNKRVNDDIGNARQAMASIAVDDTGKIHIVWRDLREAPKEYIYYANSTDGGITFSSNKRIDSYAGQVRQGSPSIAIDDSNGNIYVAWEDRRGAPTGADIFFANSTDGGITFGNIKRVNNDLGNAPQEVPFIAAKNGLIGVVWRDGSLGSNIYFANSTDGGDSFWNHKKVNSDDGSTSHEFSSIAIDNNRRIYVAWSDRRLGPRDIYFTTSTDNGTSFSIDQMVNDIVPGHQSEHSMVVDVNGVVYIAWRHDLITGVYSDVHFARSNRPPPIAMPISPLNDSTLFNNTPTLIVASVTDLDDDTVYYNFTISDQPDAESGINHSSGWIESTSWVTPVLTNDKWYWHVYTSDMWNTTTPDWIWNFTIDISLPDTTPPTADAGPDQQADQGDTIVFDGSGSSDDSGTIANYTWVFTYDGAVTTLYEVAPSFMFEKIGYYEVTLTVKDPSNNSASDTMWVNVTGVDTDGDGLTDYDEENIYLTDPNDPDTDGDGWWDGEDPNPLVPEPEDKDFLSEYWWLLVFIIIIIFLLILLFMLRKKRKPEKEEDIAPEGREEVQTTPLGLSENELDNEGGGKEESKGLSRL